MHKNIVVAEYAEKERYLLKNIKIFKMLVSIHNKQPIFDQ